MSPRAPLRLALSLVVALAGVGSAEAQNPWFPQGGSTFKKSLGGSTTLPKLCNCPPMWLLAGNAKTNPAVHFLGTTDNKALNLRVFNRRCMQYAFGSNGTYETKLSSVLVVGMPRSV